MTLIKPGNISSEMTTDSELANAVSDIQSDIAVQNVVRVEKNPGTNEFSSIATALATITTSSSTNPYVIEVGPGIFEEPVLNVPAYVSIKGESIQSTIIKPATNSQHLFVLNEGCELSFMCMVGLLGANKAAIYIANAGDFTQTHKLAIYDFDIGIHHIASTADSYLYVEYTDINGNFTNAVKSESSNGFYCRTQLENFYTYESTTTNAETIFASGTNCDLQISTAKLFNSSTQDGVVLQNGVVAKISGVSFEGSDDAIRVNNTGSACDLRITATSFKNNILDLNILHSGTTGYFFSTSDYSKRVIPTSGTFYVANKDNKIITVAKKGGDFSSIKSAMDSITDSSSSNEYIISVGPGVFVEQAITCKPYVSVVGAGETATTVQASANNHNLFDVNIGTKITGIKTTSVGTGFSAFNYSNKGDNSANRPRARLSNIIIENCDIGINVYCNNASIDTHLHADFIDVRGTFSRVAVVENAGGICACLNFVHLASLSQNASDDIFITGAGADLMMHAAMVEGNGTNNAFHIQDGASADISATIIKGCDIGFHIPNTGSPPDIKSAGVTFTDNTTDIEILRPNTTGVLSVTAAKSKVVIDSSLISISILDPEVTGFITNGPLYYSSGSFDSVQEIGQLIQHGHTMGVIDGGVITVNSGLVINVSAGYGYHMIGATEATEVLIKRTWSASTLTLPASSVSYIYINNSGTLTSDTAYPDTKENILLGRVSTDSSAVLYIQSTKLDAHHYNNKLDRMMREAVGPIFAFGGLVSENGTNARRLDVTGAEYYFSQHEFLPTGGTAITFDYYYKSATTGVYTRVASQNTIDNVYYDDASGTLASLPTGKYAKHLLYVLGGPSEKYLVVYPTAYYDTQVEAENAPLQSPPSFVGDAWARLASIVVKEGASAIQSIIDERPRIGFKASSASGSVTSHLGLTDLTAGDAGHTQFVMRDGSKAMTGALDMGTNNITNVGTVDGVDISAHASRHLPNGADPLTTGTPSSIGSSNSEGIQNAFARQDHIHAHGNQGGGTEHSDATTSVAGFMSSTDKTKLDGIASGATANSSDSFLLDRANHTGTQLASTISDFTEASQDVVAGALTNTATINFAYNDALNQISAIVNDGSITDAKLSTGINANKIDGGTVSNTAFGYLANVTSDIQTQLNGKQATGNYITDLTGDVTVSGPGSATATLSNSGVTAGSYSLVTVDAKGRVTAGSNTGSITRYAYTTTSNNTNSNATYTTVTQLTSASLPVGLYKVVFRGQAQSASATNGMGLRIINGTASVSTVGIKWAISQAANGTSQTYQYDQTALTTNVTSASVQTANANLVCMGDGMIRVTTAGTLVVQFRSDLNGTVATLLTDSFVEYQLV